MKENSLYDDFVTKLRNETNKKLLKMENKEEKDLLTEEFLDSFLTEEMGVSENVQTASNTIFNEILLHFKYHQKYVRNYFERGIKNSMYLIPKKEYFVEFVPSVQGITNVKCTVIDFISENDFKESGGYTPFSGEYNATYRSLDIRIPSINGIIDEGFTISILSHELKHFYTSQLQIRGESNGKRYNYIVDYIKNNPKIGTKYEVAFALYFTDKQEVQSNCQGIFNEIVKKKLTNFSMVKKYSIIYNELYYVNQIVRKILIGETILSDDIIGEFLFENLKELKTYLNLHVFFANRKMHKSIAKGLNYFNNNINYTEIHPINILNQNP